MGASSNEVSSYLPLFTKSCYQDSNVLNKLYFLFLYFALILINTLINDIMKFIMLKITENIDFIILKKILKLNTLLAPYLFSIFLLFDNSL